MIELHEILEIHNDRLNHTNQIEVYSKYSTILEYPLFVYCHMPEDRHYYYAIQINNYDEWQKWVIGEIIDMNIVKDSFECPNEDYPVLRVNRINLLASTVRKIVKNKPYYINDILNELHLNSKNGKKLIKKIKSGGKIYDKKPKK